MKGAREYALLFKTGQYGKLYITSGSHARGYTFRIQVLPEGEKAKPNGSQNTCLNSNAVEVYGIVSGQPGWTETYGWLHEGKWQEDFEKLVKFKKMEIEAKNLKKQVISKENEKTKKEHIKSILDSY